MKKSRRKRGVLYWIMQFMLFWFKLAVWIIFICFAILFALLDIISSGTKSKRRRRRKQSYRLDFYHAPMCGPGGYKR